MNEPTLTVEESALIIADKPPAIVIEDRAHHDQACDELKLLKIGKRRVEAEIDEIKKPLNRARAAVLSMEKRALGRFEAWIGAYEKGILDWRKADREKQEAEAARLRAEAEAKAAAEREVQEQALREAAAKADDEELRETLEQMADVVAVKPIIVDPVVPVVSVPKTVAGVSEVENWCAEVHDFGALVQAVAAGEADRSLLLPNLPELNRQARALKQLLAIPGVVAKNDPGLRG